ncbi:MAG: DNA-3-methyladenine glycosylase 2 family protein, partial [Chloroflexi bacterium]|nr:DNA-3-methyladenine glycosylase 2 family protein [Chloroflexota bacterium]
YGAPGPAEADTAHAFPTPERLAALPVEALRGLGLSRQKSRALVEAAQVVQAGELDMAGLATLDMAGLATLDDAAAVSRLRELRGVGRWTAEYVLLRGLGRLHIFPGDDVGARNNLVRWLGLPEPLTYESTSAAVACWQPYAGLIYFHLLLNRLDSSGYLA